MINEVIYKYFHNDKKNNYSIFCDIGDNINEDIGVEIKGNANNYNGYIKSKPTNIFYKKGKNIYL